MKFGGAAVATPQQFSRIASIIVQRLHEYQRIAVVVSAMGDTTDQLITLAKQVNENPPRREYDMLVSVGERISISLLAMALAAQNHKAISFTGSQSGIITCGNHSDARIVDVRPHRLLSVLDAGSVAIVAGFQGVSRNGEITTLGRGGSDTSAVALAVALNASKVEFFKDVSGMFSEDPKVNPLAVLLSQLTYADAQRIIQKGAQVLQSRSVSLASKNGMPMHVRSFHDFEPGKHSGTMILQPERSNSLQRFYEEEGCL
ncbi:MAG: aspartate kinase [Parachlamydiaceae bacterium]|nr:aspartate kinase [Parachlamydiaceae bacterium]